MWPIAKSLKKTDGLKPPTARHAPLRITYYPNKKANTIVNCSENQFTSHDLCDENHEQWVRARVQALLASASDTPFERVRPCGIQKLVNTRKFRKACGLDGIPHECLRYLPRRPLVHLTYLFTHYLRLFHFPKVWNEDKL
jgi:hypothetical protein